ncbi:MAG: hypothetical protein ACK4N5_24675, partial [Myxococcales bacterium]
EQGATNAEGIKRALGHQRQWGGRTGRILVEMGAITEEQLTKALAVQSHMPTAKLKAAVEPELIAMIPADLAEKHLAVVFGIRTSDAAETVYVAIADPFDVPGMDAVRFRIGKQVRFALAPADQIRNLIRTGGPAAEDPLFAELSPVAPAQAADPLDDIQIAASPASSGIDELLGLAPPPPAPKPLAVSSALDELLGAAPTRPAASASILDDLFAPEPARAPPSPATVAAPPAPVQKNQPIPVTHFPRRPSNPMLPAVPEPASASEPELEPAELEMADVLELDAADVTEPPELELSLDEALQPEHEAGATEQVPLALNADQAAELGGVETPTGLDLPDATGELQLEDPAQLAGGWSGPASESLGAPASLELDATEAVATELDIELAVDDEG